MLAGRDGRESYFRMKTRGHAHCNRLYLVVCQQSLIFGVAPRHAEAPGDGVKPRLINVCECNNLHARCLPERRQMTFGRDSPTANHSQTNFPAIVYQVLEYSVSSATA